MIISRFNDVLVCDVVNNEYEGKNYTSVIIYSNRSLMRVSLSYEYSHKFDDFIGCYVSFDAEAHNFDGKTKYKFIDNEIILSR